MYFIFGDMLSPKLDYRILNGARMIPSAFSVCFETLKSLNRAGVCGQIAQDVTQDEQLYEETLGSDLSLQGTGV